MGRGGRRKEEEGKSGRREEALVLHGKYVSTFCCSQQTLGISRNHLACAIQSKFLMSPAKQPAQEGLPDSTNVTNAEHVLEATEVGNLHFPLCILEEGPISDLKYDIVSLNSSCHIRLLHHRLDHLL